MRFIERNYKGNNKSLIYRNNGYIFIRVDELSIPKTLIEFLSMKTIVLKTSSTTDLTSITFQDLSWLNSYDLPESKKVRDSCESDILKNLRIALGKLKTPLIKLLTKGSILDRLTNPNNCKIIGSNCKMIKNNYAGYSKIALSEEVSYPLEDSEFYSLVIKLFEVRRLNPTWFNVLRSNFPEINKLYQKLHGN